MQTQLFDIYRANLKTAADMLTTSLDTAQKLQQQQLDAMQAALDDQVKSMRELSEVRSMEQLMALPARLTASQVERTVDFWSRMWRVAGDNQAALIGQAQSQLGEARDRTRDTAISTSTSVSNAMRETAQQEQRKTQERKSA
jgi:hypothetical protein